MFNRIKKIIANRKTKKADAMKVMLENLVIEELSNHMRNLSMELKDELALYCEEIQPVIDYHRLACQVDTGELAYEIDMCPSDVADYVDTCDVACYIEVCPSDVADHINLDEVAQHIDVEDQVADEIRSRISDFDFEDEVETAVSQLGVADLDFDQIAQEVADRLSFNIEVNV